MENVTVWADAYHVWHASVPLSGSPAKDANAARKVIRAAIDERGDAGHGWKLHVTRDRVTNHGTVVYREVWA